MKTKANNELFPVFLKLNDLNVLIIGGGKIGLEKLSSVLLNSPLSRVKVVAISFIDELKQFVESYPLVELIESEFKDEHLEGIQIVISALNNVELSEQIKIKANQKGILYNAADKPELCDFFLSSIVTKGDLKIGISTNGKSPTMAKRIKETLNYAIPDETDDVIQNLNKIRNSLKGDFDYKVKTLNEITKDFQKPLNEKSTLKRMKSVAFYSF